jgi:hypothetical protein
LQDERPVRFWHAYEIVAVVFIVVLMSLRPFSVGHLWARIG